MPKAVKPRARYAYRSAVTGRWVSAAYAKRYPGITVRVRIRPRDCP